MPPKNARNTDQQTAKKQKGFYRAEAARARMATRQRQAQRARLAGIGLMGALFLFLLLGLLVIPFPGLAALIGLGLLPTAAALGFLEAGEQRARLLCVACFNVSGLLPHAVEVLKEGGKMDAATPLFNDVYVWLVMYGAAGLGWLVLSITPSFAALYVQIQVDDRRRKLEATQQTLVEQWGREVLPDQETPAAAEGQASS